MLDRLKCYIDPKEMEIHIYNSGIYVVNYNIVTNFNDSKIELKGSNKNISISGNKLIISKLKKDELFICGNIEVISIE